MHKQHFLRIAFFIVLAQSVAFTWGEAANLLAQQAEKEKAPVEANILQVVKLKGLYVDRPQSAGLDPMTLLTGGGAKQKSFYKLCEYIEGLSQRKDIKAVLFDLSAPMGMGLANLGEFERYLAKLKAANIATYAWLENASTVAYSIAATCDHILLADFGGIDLPSLGMSSMHFRDAMDLLGVRASVARVGDFKGAVEPFTNSVMSKHLKEHYLRLLKSMNDQVVDRIAKSRGITRDAVRTIQGKRLHTAKAARAAGLVDVLAPYGTMKESVLAAAGEELVWVEKLKKVKRPMGIFELFAAMSGVTPEKKLNAPGIAVLHLNGQIVDGVKEVPGSMVSGPTVEAIDKITKDKNIKAVVVRIDSPGGSVTASESIRRALLRLSEKKEIAYSMGGTAASGGYWITCTGKPIFAEHCTVTGSIGVFAMKLSFGPLLKRLGVHVENVTIDDSAAAFGIDRQWTGAEIATIEESIGEVYDNFLAMVSQSRHMSIEEVGKVGGGRVWSGAQAKALGLVDHVGGVDDAIASLRSRANLPDDCPIVHRPKAKPPLAMLDLFGGDDDEIRALLPTAALTLLKEQGFRFQQALTILRNSLRGAHPSTQMYLMHPSEIIVK